MSASVGQHQERKGERSHGFVLENIIRIQLQLRYNFDLFNYILLFILKSFQF